MTTNAIINSKDLCLKKQYSNGAASSSSKEYDSTRVDGTHSEENQEKILKELEEKSENELDESIFMEQIRDKKDTMYKRFCDMVMEPVYIYTCLGITTLLFISTAVIFWAPNFAENVLGGEHDEVLAVFVVVCITGPVLGIIIGGAIVQKWAGGYEGKHASTISLGYAALAFICALPIRNVEGIYSFGLCLWAVLFFGGAVIPNVQGIMISSLKPELRAAGNSVSNILQNLLGFLPSPFVYGLIYNYSKTFDKKLAMTVVLWYSIVGFAFLSLAAYYRFKKIYQQSFNIEDEIELKDDNSNNSNIVPISKPEVKVFK
eukprot:CAMPEP_0170525924 /NCGR_PEP_ID=MMETSP0209-20121228/11378_1 /TAXON_ID=665100 ORGANISM="Litonotus pictus, Strain P1" /NCGR_SAMPLE_ID=MMETSP0209 /ASSEMBLY_ACC=CAM_ASM_000301 /LENGTH=316 /DNA_ID=CAMNT_0010815455 /DNA_START=493 /DNA_END=1443 /DNA_ORIENTATION=+